jgi:hypothetical protein
MADGQEGRSDRAVTRRTGHLGCVGARQAAGSTPGAAGPHQPDGGRWGAESGDCAPVETLQTDGAAVAAAIFGAARAGHGAGCAQAGAHTQDLDIQD